MRSAATARLRAATAAAAALATVLVMLAGAGGAHAAGYAPLNQPGPPLSVPPAQLAASLYCEPSVKHATTTPVLLNPPTGLTVQQDYSWTWEPALDKLGIPWCTYNAAHSTLGDIPTSGEYLVYAIRTMYALAGRRIDILGHSQGGMSMRWALRFWPDTRAMVDDVIGLSPSNHGTTQVVPQECPLVGCAAAGWQQIYNSPFIQALNSDAETFAGISYTNIWTHTDEVVVPNGSGATASAALHTGQGQITNVAIQQLCPADVSEHLLIGTVDPVAYALAADALTHAGPADPARTARDNPNLCGQLYMPGVNPADVGGYLTYLQSLPGIISLAVGPTAQLLSDEPVLHAQPALPCYVYASCTGAAAPTLVLKAPYKHVARKRSSTLHVEVVTQEGAALLGVADATVSVDGHHAGTDAAGFARVSAPLRAGHRYTVRATLPGTNAAALRIAVH